MAVHEVSSSTTGAPEGRGTPTHDVARPRLEGLRTLVAAPLAPARRRRTRHVLLGSNGPRRYLAPHLTLETFFRTLEEHGVRYAVLRWFETLPHVDPGEDVDLLVADGHLEFVHTLLRPRPGRPGSQAFDVYTVSGLPGTDFGGGVPYYPPQFAHDLLDDTVMMRGFCRVPSPLHHFQSLAYHAVYHKGYRSGLLPADGVDLRLAPTDHDYEAVLTELAERLGMPAVPTLDRLDGILADAGLRPPLDTLERLAPGNPWIHDRFFADLPDVDPLWHGLAVFVVRERAAEHVDLIADELNRHGFEVLEVLPLDPRQREAARRRIRGGNWERGPWQVSGGGPATYVLAYDVAPWRDRDGASGNNLRIPEAKAKVRDRLLDAIPAAEQYNPLHSSDNPRQALDYLDVLADPDVEARLRVRVRVLTDRCRLPYPVLHFLAPDGPSRRSRVALVDHPEHGPCVCKIYRPGAARFFERELRARRELKDLPLMPGLLEYGDNWLLTPLYQDDHRHVQRHLPFETDFENAVQLRVEAARATAELARALHERGLFVLDLTTENLCSDPEVGLRVLDLEFLQEYAEDRPPLEDSYSFRGVPDASRHLYDEPQDVPLTETVGNPVFHPAVAGLPIDALLRPGRPADAVRRWLTLWAWYLYFGVVRPPRRASGVLARSRWGRLLKRIVKKVYRTSQRLRPSG